MLQGTAPGLLAGQRRPGRRAEGVSCPRVCRCAPVCTAAPCDLRTGSAPGNSHRGGDELQLNKALRLAGYRGVCLQAALGLHACSPARPAAVLLHVGCSSMPLLLQAGYIVLPLLLCLSCCTRRPLLPRAEPGQLTLVSVNSKHDVSACLHAQGCPAACC